MPSFARTVLVLFLLLGVQSGLRPNEYGNFPWLEREQSYGRASYTRVHQALSHLTERPLNCLLAGVLREPLIF